MRAALDPNVLIAATLSPQGTPARLLLRWIAGDYELIFSDQLLAELERAFAYPKLARRVERDDAAELIAGLRSGARLAPDPRVPPQRSPDPGDDYLLALAESEHAVLVSGDQHLLGLEERLPIYSPRRFLEILEAPSRG